MAFRYIINDKVEVFENDFHFWYVNGYHPDPDLKLEIDEEKTKETRVWPEIVYSKRKNKNRRSGWYK